MISLSQPARTGDALRTFRATIRTFIQTEFAPHQDRWREQRFPDADAWTKAGAVGMLLSDVPMEYGGGGGTFAHEAVIVEELTRAGGSFASFIHDSVAHYILAYRTEEQKGNWLPPPPGHGRPVLRRCRVPGGNPPRSRRRPGLLPDHGEHEL